MAERIRWPVDLGRLHTHLDAGGILAFPTESTYAVGCDPASATGCAAVFALKGRAAGEPLPVVFSRLEQLAKIGVVTDAPGLDAVRAHWPAALSIVLPIETPLPAAAGQRSLAVRIPAEPRLLALLTDLDRPLTASSANRSGQPALTSAEAVCDLLRDCDGLVLDGGETAGGAPSTLVRWEGDGFRVLRQGRTLWPQ